MAILMSRPNICLKVEHTYAQEAAQSIDLGTLLQGRVCKESDACMLSPMCCPQAVAVIYAARQTGPLVIC